MKKVVTLIFTMLSVYCLVQAQSTVLKVYDIVQEKCVSCHGLSDPAGNLNLIGSGINPASDLYSTLVNTSNTSTYANEAGYKRVVPGRVDLSYFYRKISPGFDDYIQLATEETDDIHDNLATPLTTVEKEIIRQWIVYGAPSSGIVADEDMLTEYYSGNGLESFPDGVPAEPDPSEGFQLRMGPFFLAPAGNAGDEKEYFLKYDLSNHLDENVDVDRVDMKISNYSHHLIIYDFDSPLIGGLVPDGLRLEPYHFGIGLVAAIQEAIDLKLPQGTAFKWESNKLLDLNSHYINYSASNVYKAEVYINVYTKPLGTAVQEMKTELIVKDDIFIPNNSNETSYWDPINYNLGEIFMWGIMGHTHQYGTDYKVHRRLPNDQPGEILYDAACPEGVPDCAVPNFDYRHIPMRYFEPLLPVTMNAANGLMHYASWINDGPSNVTFGPTSDDEMMVLVLMYLTDTTGLGSIVNTWEVHNPLKEVKVFPNPMQDYTTMEFPPSLGGLSIELYDMLGKKHQSINNITSSTYQLNRKGLSQGLYIYIVSDEFGNQHSGKLYLN